MKMYSKDGTEMMDISWVDREGSDLVVKGKMLKSMPATIYIKPKEIWQAKSLLKWHVVFYMPIIILKGFWSSIKEKN